MLQQYFIKHTWKAPSMLILCCFSFFLNFAVKTTAHQLLKPKDKTKHFKRTHDIPVLMVSHYWGPKFKEVENSKLSTILYSRSWSH